MNKIANQLQQILFILLGVTIPTSIAITNLIIGLIGLCWILEGNFKSKFDIIKSSKWTLSIFALIGLYVLGMLWGSQHLNAEWQFQRLALLLVFPVFSTLNLKQVTFKNAVIAFLITTFISAVVAISINFNIISPPREYIPFISNDWGISAFIKYNYHNILLSFAFTISLYILLEKKTKYRCLLFLFTIVYSISIFTEIGRAGQVLFNLSSIFYILYYNRKYILRGFAFLLLLLSFQAVIYNSTNSYKARLDRIATVIKNNGAIAEGGEQDLRYILVKESLNKIFEKPFLGHGTGSFGTIFTNEIKSGNIVYTWSTLLDTHTTPHNQYLYVWFELGMLGILLLLSIFYYQVKELFKKKDGIHRILLPLSFMFLMLVDSYFFIFILTIAYIYLFTIYSRYQSE